VTTIVCISDLHEHLVDIPACDLLLIAGDVSFALKGDLRAKHAFLRGAFKDWLERAPAEEIVLVAGNHDQSIEAWGVPGGLRCHYVQDAGIELYGLKLWGTPW
jgi:metallophosphoesterase superfamily enzyme